MRKSEAPALKPTRKIFNEIRDKGLKIFLISSRRECIRSETVDNLLDVGYHGWATLYLRYLISQMLYNLFLKFRETKKTKKKNTWGDTELET